MTQPVLVEGQYVIRQKANQHQAQVSIPVALSWPLHNGESLNDALRHYILNFTNCPESIQAAPGDVQVTVHLGTHFLVTVSGPPGQVVDIHAPNGGGLAERWERPCEAARWVKTWKRS